MEGQLTTLTDSATTNAQRSRINILEETSVQGRTLAEPQEKTHMMYAQYLSPCLVNLIIFLCKQLPENGSLHRHFSWGRQVSSICRALVIQLCGADLDSERNETHMSNSLKETQRSTQVRAF